jgi:hypothetical protein
MTFRFVAFDNRLSLPSRLAHRSTSASVMSSSRRSPNGDRRWFWITDRASRTVDGLRCRSSAR